MAEIKVNDEFVDKYIQKITLAGNRYLEVCKSIIKEVYESGFKDGEKFVYQSRYNNKVNQEPKNIEYEIQEDI